MRLALAYACPVPLKFRVNPAGEPLMLGSGPYYIASYQAGRQLVLERNPKYNGVRPHKINRVVITFGGDVQATISAVAHERADVVGESIPFEFRNNLAGHYGVNKSRFFGIAGVVDYFLALNTSRPLFRGNVALRRAVNLALNRTAIVKLGPGWPLSHVPTDQIMTSWVRGWGDYHLYHLAQQDLRRAQKLASGHLKSKQAVLYASQVPFLLDQASLIVRELGQIGLKVKVVPIAPTVLDSKVGMRGAPFDMVLTRYFMHYPDPGDVIVPLLAGENARKPAGNTNYAYFDSQKYNREIAGADRLTGAARLQAFSRLDETMMRDAAPWAPLYEGSEWLFVGKRVGCLKVQLEFRIDFAAMCLK